MLATLILIAYRHWPALLGCGLVVSGAVLSFASYEIALHTSLSGGLCDGLGFAATLVGGLILGAVAWRAGEKTL